MPDYHLLQASSAAGGKTDGDDAAQILKAAWRETRSSVMRGNGVAEFYFRQYLFACQARLLFKLNRPTEVTYQQLFCPLSTLTGMASLLAEFQPVLLPCLHPTCKGQEMQRACFLWCWNSSCCQLLDHTSHALQKAAASSCSRRLV